MFVLEWMLINFINIISFIWLCTQVLACLEALKCVIPASLVLQTHITCYISSQGPHSLASGGEWVQFTQCLLDLMGFPKDNTAKVTCVAGKLKISQKLVNLQITSSFPSPVLSHHGSKQTLLPLDFKMGTILFYVLNAYCDIFSLFMQISPENCLIYYLKKKTSTKSNFV